MKNFKIKAFIFLFIISSIFNSCSLKPTISEKKYLKNPKGNTIKIDDLGNGKVLFYNYGYYCPVIECGRLTKVNIKANGISFGQLNYGEYFIVDLENGDYLFETERRDVFLFKAKYNLKISNFTKVIKICGNTLHKSLQVTNSLPAEISQLRNLRSF